MALKRVWHSVVDIPLDSTSTDTVGRSAALTIKKCLVGNWAALGGTIGPNGPPPNKWVLEYSCNAVAFGAVDYWNNLSDIVINATAANPRSWLAVRSPSGTKRMVWDFSASVGGTTARIGFTKDPISVVGLGLNKPPTMPTSRLAVRDVAESGGTSSSIWSNSMTVAHRLAFTMSADGEFWFFTLYRPSVFPTTGICSGAGGLWPIEARPEVAMEEPWALLWPGTSSNVALPDQASIWSGSNPIAFYLPGGSLVARGSCAPNSIGSSTLFAGVDGINGFTGKYDELPLLVVSTEAGQARGYLGVLEDLGLVNLTMQGAWTPNTGIERVAWGNLLIPFTLAPAL